MLLWLIGRMFFNCHNFINALTLAAILSKKKIRAKVGDLFQIPIDMSRVSYGQVAENKSGVLRIITFNRIFTIRDNPTIEEILDAEIVLLTDTMDAKIYNGDWKVVGNASVRANLPIPKFKFGLNPVYITDYGAKRKCVATQEETDKLDFQFSAAPIRIQNAMQAHFGVKEWDADFDKLTFQYCFQKSLIEL
ncbi:MAG TPA: Imm26 family immunity protein [Segetibacter sp.]